METWHHDVEEFLDLRKNTGDERRRTHDMHTANWIPDLFMKRVFSDQEWTLFSPDEVPDLHDLTGRAFEERYEHYEREADAGRIKLSRRIPAVQLWRKMLTRIFETGHPWITWKDPSNLRSPQDHCGVVHSSNLCTEILLNTSRDETAVCNLGSINLRNHITDGKLDVKKIEETVQVAVRMLDNVIDINFYPTDEAENANHRHRPVGLGLMGFQDALAACNIHYASDEAVEFADRSMEAISYHAIMTSSQLAAERGQYSSYTGSKWDRGLLPIDTIAILEHERGMPVDVDRSSTMDWDKVREQVAKDGMRNSNVMAIAPTATISTIIGVTQSIEPTYRHLFVKSNLSGEFTQVNIPLIAELKSQGLWDDEMLEQLKLHQGSLGDIERLSKDLKGRFATSFEIDPKWLLECAARRQKWIDMGQSLNLYLLDPSGRKLDDMYKLAWQKGLKTTYYLRTLAATSIEQT
ncbi:MAG: ribonucleoside-diphosphate reductase subunit alpha, partial [Pirellulaceae bacterium]|nr:ribonucleoside-diphosphate reductase subunit alpha [Pirellulaceae bacterium]